MKNFEIIVTSYDTSNDFVAEIWHQNNLIAIVNESSEVRYFNEKNNKLLFESNVFHECLEHAKKRLKP